MGGGKVQLYIHALWFKVEMKDQANNGTQVGVGNYRKIENKTGGMCSTTIK